MEIESIYRRVCNLIGRSTHNLSAERNVMRRTIRDIRRPPGQYDDYLILMYSRHQLRIRISRDVRRESGNMHDSMMNMARQSLSGQLTPLTANIDIPHPRKEQESSPLPAAHACVVLS